MLLGDLNDDGILDNVVGIPRSPNMFGEVRLYFTLIALTCFFLCVHVGYILSTAHVHKV